VLLSPVKDDILHAVVETPVEGLHITAPDLDLSDVEPILSGRVGREHILSEAMRTARTHYDTIVIDSPPNLGNLTLNALMAADEVIVPCDMSLLAVSGVAQLLSAVETLQDRLAHAISVLGVLRTRVDARNITLNEAVDEALLSAYPHFLLETVIPINSALAKAQGVGSPIHSFDPRCRGALAYKALSEEVMRRLEARGRSRQRRVR
jgi:chromosome partitioning protein